ncbi:hypothetical protein NCC78_30140 [Micromonospora phytophila]|nr:hypothetical protein [Micromonospora phytophila]MCM0678899.1 hypothetical protein [Micromonospora phytophila]
MLPPTRTHRVEVRIALGRVHAGKTVTIHVTDTELAIACDDGTRSFVR